MNQKTNMLKPSESSEERLEENQKAKQSEQPQRKTEAREAGPKTSLAKLKSARLWKLKNKERVKFLNKRRSDAITADPVAHEKRRQSQRASRKKHAEKWKAYNRARTSEKTRARAAVRRKIARGTMIRGACEICGNPKTDAHHDDYAKRFDVKWLCRKHHYDIHHAK